MDVEWSKLFEFEVAPLELIIRGTLMYWFIFLLLRLGGRRDIGSFGAADVLLLVLIADAAQNAMAADYNNVGEGMVLVGTLVFWSVFVDRICYFFPAIANVLEPKRVLLVKDGKLQPAGMRREYITEDELMEELREHGVDDLSKVRRAYMEGTGGVSILLSEGRLRRGRKRDD